MKGCITMVNVVALDTNFKTMETLILEPSKMELRTDTELSTGLLTTKCILESGMEACPTVQGSI